MATDRKQHETMRTRIEEILDIVGKPMTARDIAAMLNVELALVSREINRMRCVGQIINTGGSVNGSGATRWALGAGSGYNRQSDTVPAATDEQEARFAALMAGRRYESYSSRPDRRPLGFPTGFVSLTGCAALECAT